jgi:hypothetical protein
VRYLLDILAAVRFGQVARVLACCYYLTAAWLNATFRSWSLKGTFVPLTEVACR